MLTTEQIIRGYWYRDLDNDHPPKPITNLEDYTPREKLSLNITQLFIPASEQKKLINKWCETLPNLSEVKYLWFCSRVSQKMFEAACQMPNLEGLWIKWSGIKTIDHLEKLTNLKHLHLGSSSQIESIKVLQNLRQLETLELMQLNRIKDFSVVSHLTKLEGLAIEGSMWTVQTIETLEPIRSLKNLKYLVNTNSRILDQSFDPILDLKNLVRFNCSWNYPESEFEKLKAHPNLKYGNVTTSWKEIIEQRKKYKQAQIEAIENNFTPPQDAFRTEHSDRTSIDR